MFIASLRVGSRLGVGFALVGTLMLSVAVIAVLGLRSLNQDLRHIVENRHPKTEQLHAIIDEVGAISVAVRNALIAENQEEIKGHVARVNAGRQAVSDMLEKLDQAFVAEDEHGRRLQQALHDQNGGYMVELIKLIRATAGGNKQLARTLLPGGLQPRQDAYLAALRSLNAHEAQLMKGAQQNAVASYENGRNWIVSIVFLAAILTSALAYGLTRGITRPLRQAGALAGAIARGDLASRVEARGRDETAWLMRSLKAMQEQLAVTVAQIKVASETINTAAGEIALGNADLSQRTEEQASSLEETASSMEELTGTVKQNAENARQANQLAAGASDVAVKGGQVVGQVVQTMSSINDSSKKIVDIIGVIDGIAFQTNILALNAAVEAARAGEQGRGFAVVATEVRTLAQRSAGAAKEIKQLISDSVHKVEDGTRLVDEAGRTMEEIVAAVKRVTDIMAEIAAASQEQSSGIEQVNRAVTQMDAVTQQNAALVEEAAAAAESMQEQAQALAQAVAVFKLARSAERAREQAEKPAATVTPLPTKVKTAGKGRDAAEKPAASVRKLANAKPGEDAWQEF